MGKREENFKERHFPVLGAAISLNPPLVHKVGGFLDEMIQNPERTTGKK